MPGSLHVVATPIGNLEDLSARAIEVLRDSDLILAEDTRHTGKLLAHCGVDTPQHSLHEHSGDHVIEEMVDRVRNGERLALVSDAGTPLISDPGFELVRACRDAGLPVLSVPGPCAAIAALSTSGLPPDRFRFCGFPPAKPGPRRSWLETFQAAGETLIFYESTHRVAASVAQMAEVFGGGRPAHIARELTKLHEQGASGSLSELTAQLQDGAIPVKGEFVVLVAGAQEDEDDRMDDARRLLQLLLGQMSPSHAARTVAAYSGLSRQRCYDLAESLKTGEE